MKSFYIIGIAVRTINKDFKAKEDIGNLWNRWFAEGISNQIPNKINDKIINMYTDYDADEHGFYTTILGHKVKSLEAIPDGMTGKEIPEQKYKEYVSKGKLPSCVLETWQTIWNTKLNRKYNADFDMYDPKTMHPENAEVKTYVSIN